MSEPEGLASGQCSFKLYLATESLFQTHLTQKSNIKTDERVAIMMKWWGEPPQVTATGVSKALNRTLRFVRAQTKVTDLA